MQQLRSTKVTTKFMILGFMLAWVLFGAWFLLNTFYPPGLRLGRTLEAITVIMCPPSISLVASGDRLLPQLANMAVVSTVNAGWYWILGKTLIWARQNRRATGT
jgi:hypothetical protein